MADIAEKGVTSRTTNVTLTTTTETAIVTSPLVPVPLATALIVIRAWVQLTTGAGTTGVTVRIRRGSDTTGTLVGEANVETAKAVAGSTEPFSITVSEARQDLHMAEYTLTLQQAAATADGTALQATIEVEVLNG